MYAKDSISKTYSPLAYFLVKLIIELPSLVAGTLVYCCGAYWLQGFNPQPEGFLTFCKCGLM